MPSFEKISKILLSVGLFSMMPTDIVRGQDKDGDRFRTVQGDCYEVSENPKQWIRLALSPEVFHLNNLQEGTVTSTLSCDCPEAVTTPYVNVQRWKNRKWIAVKAPERQARDDIAQKIGESTRFEHPFSLLVYFGKNELIPARYRIVKWFRLEGQDVFLSAEFRVTR